MAIPVPAKDRIERRSAVLASGCRVWTGGLTHDGYGKICGDDGRMQLVHRAYYTAVVGPIPDGLTLDHLCRCRACFEPGHLEPVSRRENTLRGEGIAAQNARKTHCANGHPFSLENTYARTSGGRRGCRACSAEAARAYRKRRVA
jgi:hypothetical protein